MRSGEQTAKKANANPNGRRSAHSSERPPIGPPFAFLPPFGVAPKQKNLVPCTGGRCSMSMNISLQVRV